ncbi:maleylpyruvate isomerase family mycothiol-dependent enzyme [Streptomyces botrytidirepellens]|uniref:Maleylpyruvate isomerase family mycothiol-dependent enzyme n=1 Tax=Streptomyces botrytidirepellens TaxID=2486417 RepID=A0A3M8WPN6_9ACTN|nr:maleylpyruvate isomerase family mycothiol-dependent enzyme [Streptomyces botrytidirepellens]RNG32168.1 maleylpyruvate isomerase family mycothiol-dependent enzyme [Streptomyces botrytidirepellens]
MTLLGFDRYHAEIVKQTELLRTYLAGADMTAPVPTCPAWNLAQLVRHLGGAHGWAETVVRTRATEAVSDDPVNDIPRRTGEDPAALGAQLGEGAGRLADALREAGPDTAMWTPGPGGTAMFWARRMTHETVIHRADAALAVGAAFHLDEDVARDALDEWLTYSTLPEAYEGAPALLGPGRAVCLQATDTGSDWLVDLTGEAPVLHRTAQHAAVELRGTLTDLLLLVYRRPAPSVKVTGDTALLDLWLTRSGFWLQ